MTRALAQRQTGPTSVALIGCGSVSWLYHAPALEHLERSGRVRVEAVFDPDFGAMDRMARRFPHASRLRAARDLSNVRLAIIASPPAFHAAQTIEALRAGAAVLCEKPLADSIPDAEAMIAAGQNTGGVLAVGFVRRWLPAVRTIRDVLRAGLLGSLRSVLLFEGGVFRWPARSPFFFQRSGGGGVVADIGAHVFDLLVWWFGLPTSVDYEDDALGGVEANCRFRLRYGSEFHVTGRLSRDWELTNAYHFECTNGWLRWNVAEPERVELSIRGSIEWLSLRSEDSGAGSRSATFESGFIHQITNVIDCAEGKAPLVAPAEDGLTAMRLVARCYEARTPMRMGWLTDIERRSLLVPAQASS